MPCSIFIPDLPKSDWSINFAETTFSKSIVIEGLEVDFSATGVEEDGDTSRFMADLSATGVEEDGDTSRFMADLSATGVEEDGDTSIFLLEG
jgi:hypothetical protein